jgi:hypothetical protein
MRFPWSAAIPRGNAWAKSCARWPPTTSRRSPNCERRGRAAEEKEEGSLVVPGLSVVSVAWLEGPEVEGVVRVIQLLESGDTLEILHLPAGMDPSVLAPLRDGRTELVAPRGGGWLVVRAIASRAILQGVMERMNGGS